MHKEKGADTEVSANDLALTELHEVWLISRIAEKDRKAFEVLYRDYFTRLGRFLNRLTRRSHLVEEIVNDTMMVVWQKAHSYNHSCKVSTWIFAIAYRHCMKAVGKTDEPVDADFDTYPDEMNYQPEEELNFRQLQQKILSVLDLLPFEQRSVVTLTYYHDMGYEEISETMNCPISTVKTRMFHARRKLKNLLSAYHKEAL